MTNGSPQNDTMTLTFINPLTGATVGGVAVANSINNYTSINMEKDFFTPANGLTIVIEDSSATSLTASLQRGFKVQVDINGNPNMVGYIFDYDLSYSKGGGFKLTIRCKDLLEYMAQAVVYPNMGQNLTTNYHFKPTDTLEYALVTLANAFQDVTGVEITIDIADSANSLQFSSGFAVGLRQKGKTSKARSSSITAAFNHLTTPEKGESYLAYILRLIKHAGCNIKMSDTSPSTILVAPPTYDRTAATPFTITHYVSSPNNQQNTVIEAHYHFGLDRQPSVIIVESNTNGDGKFYQSVLKGVAINEMTAFTYQAGATSLTAANAIPSVSNAVAQLTNGVLGTGYVIADFNAQLYALRGSLPVDISTAVSLPYYTVDYNAHNKQEVLFSASMILAEVQDKYVEFTYRLQGWTMPGTTAVWQPNMMVNIIEEIFSPGASTNSTSGQSSSGGSSAQNTTITKMWIKKVNYIKTRNGGTEVQITCTLPYTHNFEITP